MKISFDRFNFFLRIVQTVLQLKDIIITDCTTRNYFFLQLLHLQVVQTTASIIFSKCIAVCKTCNAFKFLFFLHYGLYNPVMHFKKINLICVMTVTPPTQSCN